MLELIVAFALLGQSQMGDIERNYDKFSDETTLKMEIGEVWHEGDSETIELHLSTYPTKGQNFTPLKNKDKAMILFFSSSRTWKFLSRRHLIGMLNGKDRIDLGEPPHRGKIGTVGKAYVTEAVITSIAMADLERISSAKDVEFQINFTEIKLTADQIERIRDFVARMKMTDSEAEVTVAKAEAIKKEATLAKEKADEEARAKKVLADEQAQKEFLELAKKVRTDMNAAIKKAKVKAGSADLSTRSRALARETEKAKNEICEKFKISRSELITIMNMQ